MLQKTQKKDKRLRKKQKTQKKRTKDSEKGQKTQKKEQKTQIKGKLRVRQKTQKKPTKDSEKEDNSENIEALFERLKIRIISEKWMFQKVASFTKVLPCLMPKKACGTSYFSFSPLPLPFSIYVCVSKLKKFIQAEHYLMPPEFLSSWKNS